MFKKVLIAVTAILMMASVSWGRTFSLGLIERNQAGMRLLATEEPFEASYEPKPKFVPETTIFGEDAYVFEGEMMVSLVADNDDSIVYYTIDGSDPKGDGALLYDGPFFITETTLVKAVASSPERGFSNVSEGLFRRHKAAKAGEWTLDGSSAYEAVRKNGRMIAELCWNYPGCGWSKALEPNITSQAFLLWAELNGVYLLAESWGDRIDAVGSRFYSLYTQTALNKELNGYTYFPTFVFATASDVDTCIGAMLARNDNQHKTNGMYYMDSAESLIECFASFIDTAKPLGAPIVSVKDANGRTFPFNVMLSNTNGTGTIYYTLDGTAPTRENGIVYTSAVTIPASGTVLKAVVWPSDANAISGVPLMVEYSLLNDAIGIDGVSWTNDSDLFWTVSKSESTTMLQGGKQEGLTAGECTSLLKARVNGPGTFVFTCDVISRSSTANVVFMVDGLEISSFYSGHNEVVSYEVTGTGVTELSWLYTCPAADIGMDYTYGRIFDIAWIPHVSPATPLDLSASAGEYVDKILLRWNAVEYADEYSIYRSETSDKSSAIRIGTTRQTCYWDRTGDGGKTYYYWVSASNAYGESALSESVAGWKPNTYNIAFHANGGTGSMSDQSMIYNNAAYLNNNAFNRTGYTFQGWAKSKTGTVAYNDGVSVKNLATSGTVTLYAVWKPNTYNVAFNANGGSGSMSAQTMGYNNVAYLNNNAFNRTGYTFQGWAKSKTGTVAYKDGVSVKNLATSGTVSLYAIWKPNTYNVAFNANGGSGAMSAQSMTYNKAAYLNNNAFKRTGYTFQGWAKSKTGTVAYKNGVSVKNLATSGTVTLYAIWKPNTYKVAFYANGGTGIMSAQSMTYNNAAYLKNNAFKRTGYTFLGWAKSPTGAVVYKNGKAVKNLSASGATIKLYAKWAKTKYKIAFYANGGKGSMSTQSMTYNKAAYLKKNAFKRTGYTFQGWAKTKTGSVVYTNGKAVKNLTTTGGTVKLYAKWAKTKYKIAYYANGGKGSMPTQTMTYNKAAYLKKNTFKRTGYTFQGWAKSAKGAVVYKNGKAVKNLRSTAGTVKLYAKWKPITYKIAFNANGGKGSMATKGMTYNKAAYLSKNAFKRSGYIFLGWSKTKTGAVAYKNAAAVKNLRSTAGTITLYAKWAKPSYKVAFYANGGSGSMSAQAMTYNKAAYLKKNAFKRTGYTFKGWAKSPTGSVVYTNGKAVKNLTTNGGTVKLYAVWKPYSSKNGVQLWEGGPYWAETNIGAENPEDYGYYFWWGDTIGYKRVNDQWVASDGSLSNFSFKSKNTPTAGKDISELLGEGWITLDEVLVPEHDAASVHWGGQWRMPTKDELNDLNRYCTWKKTILNGVYGYAISGKDAYSSAKIFLPIPGRATGTSLSEYDHILGGDGGYWSSVPYNGGWSYYIFFRFGTHRVNQFDWSRTCGYPVRPVIGH